MYWDHNYYLHFYLTGGPPDYSTGLSIYKIQNLKEKAKLCPYITFLDDKWKERFNLVCAICTNDAVQEKSKDFVKRVGIKYRNFWNKKTEEVMSVVTNSGKDIFVCPYTDQDELSTICPRDKIGKKS